MTASIRMKPVVLAAALAALAIVGLPGTSAEAADGTWERAWGKNVSTSGGAGFLEVCILAADCQAGGTTTAFGGELRFPRGIATDAAGNVYVADTSNHRIQKFDSAGNFLLAWGKNVSTAGGTGALEVCTAPLDCKVGETTTAAGGELNFPEAVATDPAGNVYVADTGNARVQKYDGNGGFQRAWGADVSISLITDNHEICTVATDCRAGVSDGEGGEFNSAEGIAADNAGVYVSEESGNRVQRFTPNGAFVLAWGQDVITGSPDVFEVCTVAANCKHGSRVPPALGGEFDDPAGLAVDPSGRLLVADSYHDRVQRFDSAGNFQLAFGRDVVSAGPGNNGTEFEICSAAAGDTCKIGTTTTDSGGTLDFPLSVAADSTGAIYVADNDDHQVEKFGPGLNFLSAWGKDVSIGSGTGFYEVCTAAADCQAGTYPPGTAFGGELNDPEGIATDAAGGVYVSDAFHHRVQKFADPPAAAPPPPPPPPASTPGPTGTGRRVAALKRCKKKRSKEVREKCLKKAKKLPV